LSGLSSPDCFLLPALPVAISSTAAGAFDLLTLGAKLSASRDYNSGAATALRWNVCPLAAVSKRAARWLSIPSSRTGFLEAPPKHQGRLNF
jgi:hypothetical protein